jgi:hypothetical protein
MRCERPEIAVVWIGQEVMKAPLWARRSDGVAARDLFHAVKNCVP